MRTQELKKLQEKILKWCITGNKKNGYAYQYAYQIDHEDILICHNGYILHRIPLKDWFVDLRTIPTLDLIRVIPNKDDQQAAYMTDELKNLEDRTVRIFKLEDGNTVWIDEKLINECGGADYLRKYEIAGRGQFSPLIFSCNGTMQHLILPVSQKPKVKVL